MRSTCVMIWGGDGRVALAPRRPGFAGAVRRDDDLCLRHPLGDGPVHRLAVVGAIGDHRIEQATDMGGVALVLVR